ncbi:MAG: hypothetical protein JNM81_18100 [Rhodospirillaceae bacterium]|nr:hypothetical protein [Rhodospirillaceae bacterium]
MIDTANGSTAALPWQPPAVMEAPLGVAGCMAPMARRPRGFDVRQLGDGRWLLAVITDEAQVGRSAQRIEYVTLVRDAAGWLAHWAGCVPVPSAYFLNDVAIGPRGGLFATHMYSRDDSWPAFVRRAKLFLGVNTGSAVMWDVEKGWREVPHTEGSFPNGIAVDPTGSVLFVAYTYNSNVARVDLLSNVRTDIAVPLRPDNLTWAKDDVTKADLLVVAGGTGLRMISTWNCETQKPACIFPFAVAAVNSTSLDVQTLYATDRQAIPGASVAVKLGQTLYLGTAFGDRVTMVPLAN